jgi:hypothetical protein
MKYKNNIVIFGSGMGIDNYIAMKLYQMGFKVNLVYGFQNSVKHINSSFSGSISVFNVNIDDCTEVNSLLKISDIIINLSNINQNIERISSKILINLASKYYDVSKIKKNIAITNQNNVDKISLNKDTSLISFSRIISREDSLINGLIAIYRATGLVVDFKSLNKNIKISTYKDIFDSIIQQINADNILVEAKSISASINDIIFDLIKNKKRISVNFIESKFIRFVFSKIPLFSFKSFIEAVYFLGEINESQEDKSRIDEIVDIFLDEVSIYNNYV